jgi:hypothetical protein
MMINAGSEAIGVVRKHSPDIGNRVAARMSEFDNTGWDST